MRKDSWELFNRCTGRKVVVTANPTVMVADFVREYLGAECVGTELEVNSRTNRFTGRVKGGVLVGPKKREAVKRVFGAEMPDLGLGDRETDHDFMALCKVHILLNIIYLPAYISSYFANLHISFKF